MSHENCKAGICLEDHRVEVTIPGRLNTMINEAASVLDVTCGGIPHREALVIALIERGARAVLGNRSKDSDQRKVADITVAELAEAFGLLSIEAARRSAAEMRGSQEKIAEATLGIFRDLKGIAAVFSTREPTNDQAEIDRMASNLKTAIASNPGVRVVIAAALVTATADGATSYAPVRVENLN